MNDVVYITIDCWRRDALKKMPKLRSLEFKTTGVQCHAPATRWSFPALFAGKHYHEALTDDFNSVETDKTLPVLLNSEGYSTGGFCAINPHLQMWENQFNEFHNLDFDRFKIAAESPFYKPMRGANLLTHLLLQREYCTVPQIEKAAINWFQTKDSPRFLWLHLMTAHSPYYPGLRRAIKNGILSTYRASLASKLSDRPGRELPISHRQTMVDLYWQCIDLLDSQLISILDKIPDDAFVVITGDHGEELLERNFIGHRRLYDDVTRVPLLTNFDHEIEKQKEIPSRLAELSGINSSSLITPQQQESYCLASHHHKPKNSIHVSIRTNRQKLISSYSDIDGSLINQELYDLSDDPEEFHDLSDSQAIPRALERKLRPFAKDIIQAHLGESIQPETKEAEDRLRDLGYL